MPGLSSKNPGRLLGMMVGTCAVLGSAPALSAEPLDPTRPEGASAPEPLPAPATRVHDRSVTSGAGTPLPSPPITVRPGVDGPTSSASKRESVELVPLWSERRVDVVLVPARPGLSLRIRPLGSPADEEQCGSDGCVASVRPGQYEISVFDRGSDAGSRELDLTRAERLLITPPDESARTTGLVLGVAGSVLLGAGVVMSVIAYSSSFSECDDGGDCDDDTPPWLGPMGIAAGITGGIAMPIGWVLFGNNLRPRVERTPVDPLTLRSLAETARLSARFERRHDRLELGGSFSF
jgi:hypothetical protein